MVSQQSLKDYAYKIYKGEKGYSFELAMKLFPKYFYTVMSYYMEYKMSEERENFSTLSLAYELFTDALITWNELVAYSKKIDLSASTLEESILAGRMVDNIYNKQIEVSSEIIKAAENIKSYSEIIQDENLYDAAQSCINEHQKTIDNIKQIQKIAMEFVRRFGSGR